MRGRWDDWVAVVAGVAAAISWLWSGMTGGGMVAMLILGVLTVLAAVISITRPGMIATEAVVFVLGVLLFIAPWVLAFTGTAAAAWTAWITGAVIAVMGLVGMSLANAVHRRAAPR